MAAVSKYFKAGLLFALFEYLLIVTPVGIYVAIEAIQENSMQFFFLSPEWAIATIFLSFVGIANYVKEVESTGRKVLHSYSGILGLSNVLIVVAAVLNTSSSVSHILHDTPDSKEAMIFRIALFIIVTILFFIAVGGSRSYKLKHKANNEK